MGILGFYVILISYFMIFACDNNVSKGSVYQVTFNTTVI